MLFSTLFLVIFKSQGRRAKAKERETHKKKNLHQTIHRLSAHLVIGRSGEPIRMCVNDITGGVDERKLF